MNSKIIKKLLNYAHEHEVLDFSITKKDGHHVLWADNGLKSHQLKIPAPFKTELGTAFHKLISLSPTDLISNAYLKTKEAAFNLSIIPENDGEKIIINLISKNNKIRPLSHLGLGRDERKIIENFLQKKRGLIIVGSDNNQGKTTTLYSLLQKINKNSRSCYSLEKYSELELDEVNRLISHQEKRSTDLSQILKTDSEVIMIDDADDELIPEAIAAARTGRLILVGTKTESASALIDKVRDITKNDDSEILIIFQKLIKKNCPHCLKAYVVGESEELINKYWPSEKKYIPKHFFTSQGCKLCNHTSTNGQIAVFNLISLNKQEINIISSLASDILQKAANGLISISKFIAEHRQSKVEKL